MSAKDRNEYKLYKGKEKKNPVIPNAGMQAMQPPMPGFIGLPPPGQMGGMPMMNRPPAKYSGLPQSTM